MTKGSGSHYDLKHLRRKGRKLFTESMIDGSLRYWDPSRSKLSALLQKDRSFDIGTITQVLYLGGGHGTTVSHLSDLNPNGRIFVVEFGITMSTIIDIAEQRTNLFPIMEDAATPSVYRHLIGDTPIDLLYQDIAQPNQDAIFSKYLPLLREGGTFILMVKVRSITQESRKKQVCIEIMERLKTDHMLSTVRIVDLAPMQKDHMAIYGMK